VKDGFSIPEVIGKNTELKKEGEVYEVKGVSFLSNRSKKSHEGPEEDP